MGSITIKILVISLIAASALFVGNGLSGGDAVQLRGSEYSLSGQVCFTVENCVAECQSSFSSYGGLPDGCVPVAALPSAGTVKRVVDGRYLVARASGLADVYEAMQRLNEAGFSCVQPHSFSPVLYIGSDQHCPHEVEGLLEKAREAIGSLGVVDFEVVRIETFLGQSSADSYASSQWNLASLGIPEAWSYGSGGPEVKVAVIDSGIDLDHEGFVDRIADGVNFTKGMGLYEGDLPDDDFGSHGTAVSSVIGAVAGSGFGVVGVDQFCKVVPLKVSHNGLFVESLEVIAIDYAVSIGCRVINVSHGAGPNDDLSLAVENAAREECIVVGAIGNLDEETYWLPAASPYAIAVGAIDESGQRADWSTWGDHIDLLAPGENIPCLRDGNRSWNVLGTSVAAPHVVACAAILIAANPSLTRREVTLLLYAGAEDEIGSEGDSPGWDNRHGWGRLNLLNSLKLALLPTQVERLGDGRLELSWDVPENLSAQVQLVAERSANLEVWEAVPDAGLQFAPGRVSLVFDPLVSAGEEGQFYRLRPVFSQTLLDAVPEI